MTFVSSVSRHLATSPSRTLSNGLTPALFTITSSFPNSLTALSTRSRTCFSCPTSPPPHPPPPPPPVGAPPVPPPPLRRRRRGRGALHAAPKRQRRHATHD